MSVVTVTVLSDGRAVDPAFALVSLDIRRELNRLPSALLVYGDGDAASRKFPVSDSALFNPGSEIEIKARYEGQGTDQTLFKGLVVRHAFEADRRGSLLRIELRDKAVKLTRPRRSAVFADATDSDVIGKLARAAGLQATVASTAVRHASLVQYDCSDWDFLLARADANGLVLAVTDGVLVLAKPQLSGAPRITIDYGLSEIYELAFEIDALGQSPGFKAHGWDSKNQAALQVDGAPPPAATQGRLGSKQVAQKLGFAAATLLHPVEALNAELKAWADSQAQRGGLALVRGRASLPGDGGLALLQLADIKGVAQCFAGKALICGLCHRIDSQGWVTDLQFGLSATPGAARADVASPAAAGLLPAVAGLHIGIVSATADDPNAENRVKVTLPGLPDGSDGLWARLAMPEAGKDRGWYFWPEPGDEVVLGFFNQDPRQPVILGSLFGSKNAPPAAIVDGSDKNLRRGLVSKKGITIGLVDDDKAQLYLQTPGKNKILLDDDGQLIELSDQHGNKITLDKNGITLVSAKDFKVDASANVEIKGSKVDLK